MKYTKEIYAEISRIKSKWENSLELTKVELKILELNYLNKIIPNELIAELK